MFSGGEERVHWDKMEKNIRKPEKCLSVILLSCYYFVITLLLTCYCFVVTFFFSVGHLKNLKYNG